VLVFWEGIEMKSVEDLDVFKLAHQLALKTYSTTKVFPREETFSLVDQMRRAAASVGMNLMEGAMRLGSREYRQFVGIPRGSAGEVCYQLLLARDLKYISNETYQEFLKASLAKIHQSRKIRFASHPVFRDQRPCLKPLTLFRYGQTQESGTTIERTPAGW
jgi:four helix bundle protein